MFGRLHQGRKSAAVACRGARAIQNVCRVRIDQRSRLWLGECVAGTGMRKRFMAGRHEPLQPKLRRHRPCPLRCARARAPGFEWVRPAPGRQARLVNLPTTSSIAIIKSGKRRRPATGQAPANALEAARLFARYHRSQQRESAGRFVSISPYPVAPERVLSRTHVTHVWKRVPGQRTRRARPFQVWDLTVQPCDYSTIVGRRPITAGGASVLLCSARTDSGVRDRSRTSACCPWKALSRGLSWAQYMQCRSDFAARRPTL